MKQKYQSFANRLTKKVLATVLIIMFITLTMNRLTKKVLATVLIIMFITLTMTRYERRNQRPLPQFDECGGGKNPLRGEDHGD